MHYRTPLLAFLSHQKGRLHFKTFPQQILAMSSATSNSISETKSAVIYPSFAEAKDYVIQQSSQVESTVPCGELKCQHNSMLSSLTSAKVVSYAPFVPQKGFSSKSSTKKKKNKKNKLDNSAQIGTDTTSKIHEHSFAIVLSDSIFFPEGGGQPNDIGQLIIEADTSTTTKFDVTDVQNIDGTCVLACKTGGTMEDVSTLLTLATQEKDNVQVSQNLNWEKRWEYMTSHSAQHLISAVAQGEYSIGTQSFSLRKDSLTSYIDFLWDDAASDSYQDFRAVFDEIEQKVNTKIQEDLSMSPTWIDMSDKESYKEQDGLRSRLLPKGLTGKIRLVEIDGVDLNTCCGTHVTKLSQLQMIKFFRIEKFKSNIIRVYFAAGQRLLKIMDQTYSQNANLMNMLSCTEQEISERVNNLLEERKNKDVQLKALKDKLCMCHTVMIEEELKKDNIAVMDLENGFDMGYMTMLSNEVSKKSERQDSMILLVCRSKDSFSDEGSFLLTGPEEKLDNVKCKVSTIFEGRGGGKNGKFQGKGMKINNSTLEEVKRLLSSIA